MLPASPFIVSNHTLPICVLLVLVLFVRIVVPRPLCIDDPNANKYLVDGLHVQISLVEGQDDWPLTLEGWDKREAEIYAMRHHAKYKYISAISQSAAAIRFAHEFGCPREILPAAFYHLARTDVMQRGRARGPGGGYALLSRLFAVVFRDGRVAHGVRDPLRALKECVDYEQAFPETTSEGPTKRLCVICDMRFKEWVPGARRELWRKLPEYFEVMPSSS
ncbi:hypothetical protein V8D89_002626 [Ganoderma adspersum]